MMDERNPLFGKPEDLAQARTQIEELRREISRQAEIITYLEDAARELTVVARSTPSAIIALDPDGIVTAWNPAAERLFGWSSIEVIGQPYPLVPQEEFPKFQRILESNLQGRPASRHAVHRLTKDGSTRPVSLETAALRDEEGAILGVVGILTDITEQLAAEAERETLMVALQAEIAKVRALSDLLPICVSCKKIRDEDGLWCELERYVAERTDEGSTPTYCPTCAQQQDPPTDDT